MYLDKEAVKGRVKAEFNDNHNDLSVILNFPETLKFLRTLNEKFSLLLDLKVQS